MAEFINTVDVLGDDAVMDSIIDRTITEFKDNQVTFLGDRAFRGCTALTLVDLPNVISMEYYVFAECTALVSVNLPLAKHAHQNCFNQCTSLEEIVLPSAVDLNNGAFYKCSNLKKVDTSIARYIRGAVFAYCSALTMLILRNETNVCNISDGKIVGTPIDAGTGYIYVPRALIEDYKVATNWSVYADQFRALEDYTVDGTITGELDETKI